MVGMLQYSCHRRLLSVVNFLTLHRELNYLCHFAGRSGGNGDLGYIPYFVA
jgi:hypothetical protein